MNTKTPTHQSTRKQRSNRTSTAVKRSTPLHSRSYYNRAGNQKLKSDQCYHSHCKHSSVVPSSGTWTSLRPQPCSQLRLWNGLHSWFKRQTHLSGLTARTRTILWPDIALCHFHHSHNRMCICSSTRPKPRCLRLSWCSSSFGHCLRRSRSGPLYSPWDGRSSTGRILARTRSETEDYYRCHRYLCHGSDDSRNWTRI